MFQVCLVRFYLLVSKSVIDTVSFCMYSNLSTGLLLIKLYQNFCSNSEIKAFEIQILHALFLKCHGYLLRQIYFSFHQKQIM